MICYGAARRRDGPNGRKRPLQKESNVKSALIAVAAALVLPLPAAAQSLDETHELVWHPAGKTPAAIHRMRDRSACSPSAGHHQSGKMAMPAKRTCVAEVAKAPAAPKGGEPAFAQ
jgi:hypothetical protein